MDSPIFDLLGSPDRLDGGGKRAARISAAEAETAGLFHNAQQARPIRYILTQLGHPQPPTPIKTDNATANAFIHQTMRHKTIKSQHFMM